MSRAASTGRITVAWPAMLLTDQPFARELRHVREEDGADWVYDGATIVRADLVLHGDVIALGPRQEAP